MKKIIFLSVVSASVVLSVSGMDIAERLLRTKVDTVAVEGNVVQPVRAARERRSRDRTSTRGESVNVELVRQMRETLEEKDDALEQLGAELQAKTQEITEWRQGFGRVAEMIENPRPEDATSSDAEMPRNIDSLDALEQAVRYFINTEFGTKKMLAEVVVRAARKDGKPFNEALSTDDLARVRRWQDRPLNKLFEGLVTISATLKESDMRLSAQQPGTPAQHARETQPGTVSQSGKKKRTVRQSRVPQSQEEK